MGLRPSKVSCSVGSLRSQVFFQEDANLQSILSTSKQLDSSVAPRSVTGFSGIHEHPELGYQTGKPGRPPGRSVIYRMPRSPYFRVNPTTNVQGSTALDDDFGSAGLIRRIRQKSNLMFRSKEAFSSLSGKYLCSPSTPLPKDVSEGSMSVQKPLRLDQQKYNIFGPQTENGICSSPMAPPQSSEKAHQLFQKLEILLPSPNEKPSELNSIGRDESPSKLALAMLHGSALKSIEDVNSSNFFNMQENGSLDTASDSHLPNLTNSHSLKLDIAEEDGPSKSVDLEVLASEVNGASNAPIHYKDAMCSGKSENISVSNSVALPVTKKPAFQITVPEDLLELDDDEYLPNPTTLNDDADTKKSMHNDVIPEMTISEKPPIVSSTSVSVDDTPGIKVGERSELISIGRDESPSLTDLLPSPNEKPSELNSIGRDESPSKLVLSMLHGSALKSIEDVNSSNFFYMQENGSLDPASDSHLPNLTNSRSQKLDIAEEDGPSKFVDLEVLASEVNGVSNAPIPSKDAMYRGKSENITASNSVALPVTKKPAFRITAPEDLLELDADEYLPNPTTPNDDADTKKSIHNDAISEMAISEKPPIVPSTSVSVDDDTPGIKVREQMGSELPPATSTPFMMGSSSASSSFPFAFGSSSGSSSSPFMFGSSSGSVCSTSSSQAPAFGAQKPAFGFGSASPANDQMNVKVSTTAVTNNVQTPLVPTFEQQANRPTTPRFMFASPSDQPVASPDFQTFGQPANPSTTPSFGFGSPPDHPVTFPTFQTFGQPTNPSTTPSFVFSSPSDQPVASPTFQTFGQPTNPVTTPSFGIGSLPVQPVASPVPQAFGQPNTPSTTCSMFGSISDQPVASLAFKFGGLQIHSVPQNPSPFQSAGNADFNPGGSFTLSSGGSDVKVKHGLRRW